jgi:hypothetical protein
MNHLLATTVGYQKGFTVFIGAGFDLDQSFTVTPGQSTVNTAKGYYVTQGLSGESVYKYKGETPVLNLKGECDANVGVDSSLMIGKSTLLVEYVEGQDRLNAIKANDKIRTNTFDYIEYGTAVEPQPVTTDTDVFYVGWSGIGDGKTPENFMNSVGWKTGLLIDIPSNVEGEYGENTDETTGNESTSGKYPENAHLWYYFNNYGGTYVAKQKMYVGGSTAILNAPTPITFTAVQGGVDYRNASNEYGYFIIACAPIGTLTDGTEVAKAPYYVRIANSEVIFDNITIYNRAGEELKKGFGVDNVIDSQTPYFIVDNNGKLVIKDSCYAPNNYIVGLLFGSGYNGQIDISSIECEWDENSTKLSVEVDKQTGEVNLTFAL